MDKKQLMAGTLAALTVVGSTPAAFAAQTDTQVPYAVMSAQALEDAGISLLSQEEENGITPLASTLQDQINAAEAGVETRITLQGNVSEDLTIPADKKIVLDLGGFKLTNVSGHTITNNGTLTIEGTGTVDCTTHAKGAVNNNGTLTISGGTITRSVDVPRTNSWYVVNNAENATMIIDGGEIIGNSTYSSCIRNLGNATVSGGTIRQDKMIAMKNDDTGTLTVTGGKIISEDQAIQNWKTAEIEGGEIEGNVYTWAYVEKGTEFAGETTISGGKITGDVAAVNYDGGSAKPQVEVTGNAEITGEIKTSNYDNGAYTTKKNDETAKITVSGGKFTTTPAEEYIDPSAEFDATSGTVSAIPAEKAVVSVGTKNYKTLAAAINAAQNGETVVLKQDVTESVTVPAGKEITLDLAGKNIQSNDSTSRNAVTVEGKLTVKDSTAATAPEVSGDVVTYVSGKITASNLGLYAIKGGEIILESGSVESTGNMGVYAQGNFTPGGAAQNSKITVKGGYILAQECAASAQGNGATLDIQGGVLQSKDNAVVSGNGTKSNTKDCGGTIMNISGGTMIGGIKSKGYIACGVYHPQQGTLNITGGKFQITNGVGVLVRAGSANITGGEIVTTGSVNGKVGDSQIIEGCFGVVYDTVSKYPGAVDADKVAVGGDVKIVTDDGNAPVKMRRPESSTENKIVVTGGTFSGPVEKEYLNGLNAELNTGKGDAPYSYYTTVEAAKEAAKTLGGGTVTDLTATPSTTSFTVTLKFADDVTVDQTITVAENGIVVLPMPTRAGYAFQGWTDGTNTYPGGDAYTVTAEATLTATWKKTAFTVTLDYANNGETATENRGANDGDTITLPTPTRSGRYAFVHWTDGTNTYAGGTNYTVTKDATLTAVWRYTGSSSSGITSSYPVSVPRFDNGSVSVTPGSASKGTTVTITVKPDEGYELDKITVTDKDGNRLSLSDKGDGKYTFVMPDGKVSVDASFSKIAATINFRDVNQSDYYYDAVQWAVEKGITEGTSATTFSPDASCTRAQMVTFLYRAAGSPAPKSTVNPFTDVSASDYYYNAVLWAVENGITTGVSADRFAPGATVSRAQTVTFLYRANGSPAASGASFSDVAAGEYYANAVAWAVQNGITTGTGNGKFTPNAPCTRGQIVTFLYRSSK